MKFLSSLFSRKKPPSLRSVLFVCTANVTRSPAAAALLSRLTAQSPDPWRIESAGIRAGNGYPANPLITYLMFQRNISVADHRSRPVDPNLLNRFYWIITMERYQRDKLVKMVPEAANRIFNLRDFGKEEIPAENDMPDPTGKNENDYYELLQILDEEIPRLYRLLENRISDIGMEEE